MTLKYCRLKYSQTVVEYKSEKLCNSGVDTKTKEECIDECIIKEHIEKWKSYPHDYLTMIK